MHDSQQEQTQIFYARIAGFVYLLLIVMFMSGEFLISGIVGSGNFAASAQNAGASERLYRIALALQVMTPVCTIVLAYALYVAVTPVNERVAQMALLFRLGETFVGAVVTIFSFEQLRLYTIFNSASGMSAEQFQALMTLARHNHFIGFNISTLFFSFGSILFFKLFLQSGYLPKVQAVLGIFASIMVVLTSVAGLVFPEHGDVVQLGFAPMFISEIVTGLWLLVRGVAVRSPVNDRVNAPQSAPLTAAGA